jgi:hypothetical protein
MKKMNAILPLGAMACWLMLTVPGSLHAQTPTPTQDAGQQGEFDGDYTDTGAAAVDSAGGTDVNESAEANVSTTTTETAEAAGEKVSSTDTTRMHNQQADASGTTS